MPLLGMVLFVERDEIAPVDRKQRRLARSASSSRSRSMEQREDTVVEAMAERFHALMHDVADVEYRRGIRRRAVRGTLTPYLDAWAFCGDAIMLPLPVVVPEEGRAVRQGMIPPSASAAAKTGNESVLVESVSGPGTARSSSYFFPGWQRARAARPYAPAGKLRMLIGEFGKAPCGSPVRDPG